MNKRLLLAILLPVATFASPAGVLVLEAVGTADKAEWQYALVRATSGGLEVKLGDRVVWTAQKGPQNRVPTLPHFSIRRPLPK
jgi:hypothetical protein